MWMKHTITALAATTLVACGGGGSSSSGGGGGGDPTPAAQNGVFVDSPVAGVSYRTSPGGLEGTTNADGGYQFQPGDTVVFSIGELEFPEVSAKGLVTPLDMADTDDLTDPRVVNIARLLQSLDDDGDASNGIRILEEAALAATPIDFNQPSADFENDDAVTNLVANSGSDTVALLPEAQTSAHLADSLEDQQNRLLGSWVFRDANGALSEQTHIVLSFLPDQTVVIANDEPDDDDRGQDGFELGSYQWNPLTGVLDVTVDKDTNGEWGLSDPCGDGDFVLDPRGDQLVVTEVNADPAADCEPVDIAFQRQPSDSDEFAGSWALGGDGAPAALLTLMGDGGYMLAEMQDTTPGEDDTYGQPGIERGTYSVAANNQVVFNTLTNTDGDRGFSHPCAVILDIPSELALEDYNRVDCGPDGRDIVQTLTVNGGALTFISEADTLAEGTVQPAVLQRAPVFEDVQETDDNTGDEELDVTGSWTLVIDAKSSDCPNPPGDRTGTFTFTQTGTDLSVQATTDRNFEGELNGRNLVWSGTFPENRGSISVVFQGAVDGSGDAMSGGSTFTFANDQVQCSGTTTFTGTRD